MIFSNPSALNRVSSPCIIENSSTVMGKGRLFSTRIFQVAVLKSIFLISRKSFPTGKLAGSELVNGSNIDSGNDNIIKQIKRFGKKKNFIILKSIERDYFIYLLSKAKILIGNSSSGIIEASSFKLPVINIGNRQRGRLQSSNIVNVTHSERFIFNTILKILKNKKLIKKLKKCRNPYGNGDSSKKIVHILKNIKINKKLLDKENTY